MNRTREMEAAASRNRDMVGTEKSVGYSLQVARVFSLAHLSGAQKAGTFQKWDAR
jgi:hypothetical protein